MGRDVQLEDKEQFDPDLLETSKSFPGGLLAGGITMPAEHVMTREKTVTDKDGVPRRMKVKEYLWNVNPLSAFAVRNVKMRIVDSHSEGMALMFDVVESLRRANDSYNSHLPATADLVSAIFPRRSCRRLTTRSYLQRNCSASSV